MGVTKKFQNCSSSARPTKRAVKMDKKVGEKKYKQKRSLSARPTRRAVVLDQLPAGEEGGGDDETELLGGITKDFQKDINFHDS